MSDNNENVDQDKTPEGPLQTDHGTTTIEENVVAKIAGMAALTAYWLHAPRQRRPMRHNPPPADTRRGFLPDPRAE